MAAPWERYQSTSDETGPWSKYAAPAAAPVDPYQQAAIAERDALKAQGIDTGAGYTRRLAQGASFGLADEVVAAAMTPLEMVKHGTIDPREGFNYAKARENLILDDARKNTGIAGAIAEGVGGLATGGALAKSGMLPSANLAPSAGLLKRAGVGALEGAGMGGVYGAAEGEGLKGRLVGAAEGVGMGAAAGGAFSLASHGVSSVYRAIQNSRAGNQIAKQTGVSPEVMRMMGNALNADGTLGPQGIANMQRAGSEAMLADAGPNAKAILDTAIQRGGPGSVVAREAIAARAGRGAQDISAALDTTLGKPQGVTATQASIRKGSAGARRSAYDDAYSAPIDYADPRGQAIEGIVKTRVPQSAINEANALMRAEGNHSKQILARVADDGTVEFENLPDVRQLDYITRGLNEVADQADGAGKLGGTTAKGRAYSGLSKEIRDHLKDLVPEYGKALETAADPIRRSKAVEIGSKLLSPSMTRDAAAEAIKGMTSAERAALAQGVRSRIDDQLAQVTRTVQDGNVDAREAVKALKDLSSRANREKLAMAIGKQKADQLFAEVDRVATSFDLRASVAENSKTYARQATDRRIANITQPGPVGKLAQGEPINATRRLVQIITGKTPEKIAGKQDAIYSELARLLTAPRTQAAPIFKGMYDLSLADATNQAAANKILRVLNRNQPAAVYPLTTLSGGSERRR